MAVQRIEHVLVLTDDIDATRDFYRDAIGLVPGARPPLEFGGHWLYAGEVACVHVADRAAYAVHAATLGLEVPPGPGGRGPVDHVALAAAGYDEVVTRLERCGVAYVANEVPAAGLRQLFVDDPNGVRVEINLRA